MSKYQNLTACYIYNLVMQRFKDRKLLAPVTPPSQLFSGQVSITQTNEVSFDLNIKII